jgi:hypothetical protein
MVVIFRVREISRGIRKLARTLMLIKKNIFLFPCLINLCRLTFLSERKEIEMQANLILTLFVFTVFFKKIKLNFIFFFTLN